VSDGAPPIPRAGGEGVVRSAGPADARQLLALMCQLARFEGYAANFAVTERDLVERGLGPVASPQFTAFVAEDADGALRGYAVVYAIPFTYDLRPTLVLKELFVDAQRRGTGAGTALMAAVIEHARTTGCGRLKWDVLPDNERAKAFYRRFGGGPDAAWEHWILRLHGR
jgi:GNAT superfamily N-acetyltransferase